MTFNWKISTNNAILNQIKKGHMEILIENILFWIGYWLDAYLPIANMLLQDVFLSIVINRVYGLIRDYVIYKSELRIYGK